VSRLDALKAARDRSDGLLIRLEALVGYAQREAVGPALLNQVDQGIQPSDPAWPRFRSNAEGLRECVRQMAALVATRSPAEPALLHDAWEQAEDALRRLQHVVRRCDDHVEDIATRR
jgi:hypothetical protein